MALQKQVVSVTFTHGIETKIDPKQAGLGISSSGAPYITGKFLTLENVVFTSPGRFMKRNGYQALSQDIEGISSTITSGAGLANFKNEILLLTGTEGYSYSDGTARWTDKQTITNLQLSSQQITRNTYNQTSPDAAIHSSGIEIVTYEDSRGGSRYCIIDSETQEQIVSDALISSTAIKPKPFAVGNFLIILYIDTSSNNLMLLPVPVVSPSLPLAPRVAALSVSIINPNYDAALYDGNLFVAFNSSASGIGVLYINMFTSPSAPVFTPGENASSCIALATDSVLGQIWVAYHNGSEVKYFIVTNMLNPVLAPTNISANSNTILNISLIASNGVGNVYYTQIATLPSNNFILEAALTNAGIVSGNQILVRSVSIAGKPFTQDNFIYITTAFDSVLQPTYFTLRTIDAAVVAKFCPGIGGGTAVINMIPESCPYIEAGLYIIGALQKDLLTTISGTVYTQTGVNLITLDFTNAKTSKVELGANLHLTGGILNQYDGTSIVEHGFNIFPENITTSYQSGFGGMAPGTYQYSVVYSWMDSQGQVNYSAPSVGLTQVVEAMPTPINFTGTFLINTDTITVSSTTGLRVGQSISDITTPGNIGIPALITAINGNTITITNLTPGSSALGGDAMQIASPGQVGFGAIFAASSHTLTATTPTNVLYIGMPFSDLSQPSNIPANTFITNIVGSTITINNLTAGPSLGGAGDIMLSTAPGTLDAYSTFISGATSINVSNTNGFFVGQVITDITTPSNFATNTIITAVNSSTNSLTINQPTAGASASSPGDLITTADSFSSTLVIPTLRLTQKKPPVRTPVTIQVYRTESDQTIFYLISSVTRPLLNDTTIDTVTFVDTSNDTTILGNPTLYTTGGVIENIAAPAFSHITTYQDRIIGITEENPFQWWYSKQNISGAPVEFTDSFVNNVNQLGGQLVATQQMDSELIFFQQNQIEYITGAGPDSTGNQNTFSSPLNIAADVGCTDKNSLVLMPAGILFKSAKGIYLLGRNLQLQYVGAAVEKYNQFAVVSANLIENTQQVRFCLSNSQAIVYDYYIQEWSTFTNISAEDSIIFQGEFTYLTEEGLVLMETPGQYTDNGEFIKLKAVTSWLSFVGLQGFQRVYQMLFLGDYFNPHNVAVYAAYDFNPFTTQQNVVQAGNILGTGVYGSDSTYGETNPYGGPPQTYQSRVNLNRQKCQAIQITIEDQQLGASFGENLALSAFAFSVRMKGTANKIIAQGANTNMP